MNYRTIPADTLLTPVNRIYVSQDKDIDTARALGNFSDCVVKEDLAHSDALLRTVPASDAERSAARALAPALGRCLVAGNKLAFSISSVRAMVSDGLWTRFVSAETSVSDPRAK